MRLSTLGLTRRRHSVVSLLVSLSMVLVSWVQDAVCQFDESSIRSPNSKATRRRGAVFETVMVSAPGDGGSANGVQNTHRPTGLRRRGRLPAPPVQRPGGGLADRAIGRGEELIHARSGRPSANVGNQEARQAIQVLPYEKLVRGLRAVADLLDELRMQAIWMS